ncbi:MAG TPA: hypothetical protein VJ300_09340 [Thermoplasmata archaeon]|nr:hypothetical protein [Thermoplasmata archaeon]
MMPTHVRLLVEQRNGPRLSPELERYLRWEYGPDTGAGYLLAELERITARRPPKARRTARSIVRAITKALKALVARPEIKGHSEVSGRPGPHA